MTTEPRDASSVLSPDSDGVRVFINDRCANCISPMPETVDGLFCSDWCSEVTKNVRYFRRVLRDGRIEDPDVQDAIRTRLAFLPSGGYKALGRTLSPQLRAQLIDRDRGRCQQCGEPGTEVDHIAGSSPDPSNLQLLCRACHMAKTQQSMVAADQRTTELITTLMTSRVFVDEPRLLADDETTWDGKWRRLKKARRQRLLDQLDALGVETTGVKSRTDLLALRDHARTSTDDEDAE